MFDLFGNSNPQSELSFPVSLTEKYRPRTMAEFVGLAKPKALCAKLAANPFPSAWLFIGPSGTGKTTMAMAIGEMVPAEVHHIPSQECNLANLERVCRTCAYVPAMGKRMHLILVDEADQMSLAARLFLLSKLDSTALMPNTIWIFTANSKERLKEPGEEGEGRFLSRVKVVEFSSYGIAADTAALLQRIWDENAPNTAAAPNFARLVKDSSNNVRAAIMALELELMMAS
jgi:replication-associated recombination protein RarA